MAMTMVEITRPVTGGVDTHLDVHVAAAVDAGGGVLGVESFATTSAEVAGAIPSGTVHSTFEADDLASLGKVLDSIYADADMLAMMQSGTAVSWTSSILGELPLS